MAIACKQNWCAGLTAMASVCALLISIYTLRTLSIDKRLEKVEQRNDTVIELAIDMKYTKEAVVKIEQLLSSKNL